MLGKSGPTSIVRLSPLPSRPGSRTNRHDSQPQDDLVDVAEISSPTRSKAPLWAAGFGALAVALAAGPVVAQVMQVTAPSSQSRPQLAPRFFELALGRGEQQPRGQALEVLQEYSQTDFGQEMIQKVVADFDSAIQKGWLDSKGDLTDEGEFAGFTPFRIIHSDGSAQASLRSIELPERFATHFFGSGLKVFPLAIVHHEFGHTQFGQPPQPHEILTDHNGSRLRVEHEMEIVDKFENPVRIRYGYEARTSYRNPLGECAGQCQPPN